MSEYKSDIIDAVNVLTSSNVSIGNIAKSLDITEDDVNKIKKVLLDSTDPIEEMYVAVNKYNSMIATVDMLIAKEKDSEDPDLVEIHKLLDKEEKYQKAKVDLLDKLSKKDGKRIPPGATYLKDYIASVGPEQYAEEIVKEREEDKKKFEEIEARTEELEEEAEEPKEEEPTEENTKQKLIGFDPNGEPIFEEIDTEPDEIVETVETDKREKIEYIYRLMINLDARNKTWNDLMYLTKTEEVEIRAAIGCNEKDYRFVLKHLISRKIPKHPSGKEHMKRMRKKWLR